MRTASEIFRENRIVTNATTIGRHYALCPQCSLSRKPAIQKLKCLGVTIASEGVMFGCNHCGWTGGWKYEVARPANQPVTTCQLTTTDDSKRSDFPLRVWATSLGAEGTPVENHLAGLKLALPDGHEEVLRFHPSCPFGPDVRQPCMVALFRDINTNQPKAIHRTALTLDGQKIGRMSLGPIGGCAIKLTPDEDVTEGLAIGEGGTKGVFIETAKADFNELFRVLVGDR